MSSSTYRVIDEQQSLNDGEKVRNFFSVDIILCLISSPEFAAARSSNLPPHVVDKMSIIDGRVDHTPLDAFAGIGGRPEAGDFRCGREFTDLCLGFMERVSAGIVI